LIRPPSQNKDIGSMKKKIRADELLVACGGCESRSRAQALILAGKVKLGTERIDKSSRLLPADSVLEVEKPFPFVGRGGMKLENFISEQGWSVKDLPILDLGASTGGFTDCLLQRGANKATCVDVGHGQLHYKLRTDPRVTNLEKCNLRDLLPKQLPLPHYPLVVMDLSFISLKKVLVRAWSFVAPHGKLSALIKPQFECLREEADRGRGVIRDEEVRTRVLDEITSFASENLPNAQLIARTEAKPRGTDGNVEYFVAWQKAVTGID